MSKKTKIILGVAALVLIIVVWRWYINRWKVQLTDQILEAAKKPGVDFKTTREQLLKMNVADLKSILKELTNNKS